MSEILLLAMPKKGKGPKRYKGDNAFGVLGIPPSSSRRAIRKRYLELARQFHPDLNPAPEARRRFEEITRAYELIMKGGDYARLLARCKMIEVKREYADQLKIVKQAHILAGMKIDPPLPEEGPQTPEIERHKQKMADLGSYLMFKCPRCGLKERCGRVTGFFEVEDIHNELVRKGMARAWKRLFDQWGNAT
jgi:hypothetical protein